MALLNKPNNVAKDPTLPYGLVLNPAQKRALEHLILTKAAEASIAKRKEN